MYGSLQANAEKLACVMRVQVSGKQRRLEKHHAGRPHLGRAAQLWQQQFSDDGLHYKEEERAGEHRSGENEYERQTAGAELKRERALSVAFRYRRHPDLSI